MSTKTCNISETVQDRTNRKSHTYRVHRAVIFAIAQLSWYRQAQAIREAQLSLRICRSYCSFNSTEVVHQPQYKSGLKIKKPEWVTQAHVCNLFASWQQRVWFNHYVWPFVIYTFVIIIILLWKPLNGFLMTQREMALKLYNVRKLDHVCQTIT